MKHIDHCIQVVLECAWWPESPGVDGHEEVADIVWLVWLVGLRPSTSAQRRERAVRQRGTQNLGHQRQAVAL
ncbi:MAG TPA: hypothetical protein VEX11_02415, partial [Acetobacteraceae bacterium]|nr:hypothetical protein [Acetobacteraceae bacterium]